MSLYLNKTLRSLVRATFFVSCWAVLAQVTIAYFLDFPSFQALWGLQ